MTTPISLYRLGYSVATQVAVVTAESRDDVSAYGFWKRGTTVMFDIRTVHLDAGSYLLMTPENDLEKVEKDKNELYFQACLERRHYFTPMV